MTPEDLRAWAGTLPADDLNALARAVYDAARQHYNGDHKTKAFKALKGRFDEDGLWDALDAAEAAFVQATRQAEEERSRRVLESEKVHSRERARRQAEIRKIERARIDRADKVKALAAELGSRVRWAQRLIRDGTTDGNTAERMAKVLGGSPSKYFKEKGRAGRRPDLIGLILRARVDHATFDDFAEWYDGPLTDALLEMTGGSYRVFDDFAVVAAKRGVDAEVAHVLWLAYVRWRATVVADQTAEQIEQRLSDICDFY